MQNIQQNEPLPIERIDLEYFKNSVLIFALSTIISIILSLMTADLMLFLSSFVEITGLAFLAFGTMNLAKKYPYLSSGIRAAWLLILLIAIEVISSVLYFFPTNSPIDNGSIAFMILIAIIVEGIITLFTANNFSDWFNLLFKEFNPIKSFFYFGILSGIGSIGVGFGTLLLIRETNIYGGNAFTFFGLIFMGSLMLIVGEIFYIVAGFKFYYRVNDKILGKIPLNRYQTPYYTGDRRPPNVNLQQFPPYGSQQLSTSDSPGYSYPPYGSSIQNTPMLPNCVNCGNEIDSDAKFCPNCGQMIR